MTMCLTFADIMVIGADAILMHDSHQESGAAPKMRLRFSTGTGEP